MSKDPEKIDNAALIKSLREPKQATAHKSKQKNTWLILLGLILLLVVAFGMNRYSSSGDNQIVSENNIHWHAKLFVYKNNVLVPIPAGVGLVNINDHPETLHTHAEDSIVHMEIKGPVRAKQIELARFLETWNNPVLGEMKSLKVNGVNRPELGSYVMHDHDEIEAYF